MRRLDGQTAVVTGAAGALGSRIASGLRAAGARVVGIDRNPCDLCDETILADLGEAASLAALSERLGGMRVDLLVNVAGAQYFGPADAQPADSVRLCYAVNLLAPALLARAVLPGMLARGMGQIANVGSVMGIIAYPYFATYSSAKAGLCGLSDALRREVAGRGVAITHVSPRAVATGFNSATVNRFLALVKIRADDPGEVADRIVGAILSRRRHVAIGAMERVFARIDALMPALIDQGLSGQAAKARTLFS